MKIIKEDDITICLGENATENSYLVKTSSPMFTWMHLDSFPSGHVIVQATDPSSKILNLAARLCLEHTKYRRQRNIKVSYCLVENLRPTNVLGEVEYVSQRKTKYIKL
jgi:predicted ribosome quality control (RQC) complex YloA/Tae2 family protein